MKWTIKLTEPALRQFGAIKDTRIKEQIGKRIDALVNEPEQQGKPLNNELAGFYSIRAVGQRYRIIYKLEGVRVLVVVVTVGIHKEGDKNDAYALAKKLARLGLLDIFE